MNTALDMLKVNQNLKALRNKAGYTLLGHSSLKQTMVYAHVLDKRRESQIDNFDQLFS